MLARQDAERVYQVISDLPVQEVVVLMALNVLQWDEIKEAVTTVELYQIYRKECLFWDLGPSGKRS